MSNHTAPELNDETDSRFWAQTGYKPGQKLDPKNSADKAMAKVWLDIYAKVKKEDAAGILQLTHTTFGVQDDLNKAAEAHNQVIDHLTAAVTSPDPIVKDDHVKAAAAAQNTVKNHTRAAAAQQPPVVSPQVAASAAIDALKAAGGGPSKVAEALETVLAANPTHPAHAPAAQPVAPELVKAAPLQPVTPPKTIEDHVALHQAQSAPGHAIAVHENAGRPKPRNTGIVPPRIIAMPPRPLPVMPFPGPIAASPAPASVIPTPPTSSNAEVIPTPPEKHSWFREHAEALAIGGTLLVGGVLAIAATSRSSKRSSGGGRSRTRTIRVVRGTP